MCACVFAKVCLSMCVYCLDFTDFALFFLFAVAVCVCSECKGHIISSFCRALYFSVLSLFLFRLLLHVLSLTDIFEHVTWCFDVKSDLLLVKLVL